MKRLDVYLYENKLFPSRDKAKEAILSGIISVNDKVCTKPAENITDNHKIDIIGETLKYVSRAGLKLEKAAQIWNLDFKNKVVLDVGASTGGFTDFALQNGARKVYSIDVGTDQLHEKLKNNPNVINMQKITFISALSLYFDFISKSFTIFVNWKRVYCYILCDILALQRGETEMRFINYITILCL